LERREQILALGGLAAGQPEDAEHRRHDVNGADRAVVRPSRRQHAREPPDERHADGRVVDEDAVRLLAVLAEALAVVGGQDDQRVIEDAGRAEPVEEAADALVGLRDLRVVGRWG
jgi:hypothetical protein